MLCCFDVLFASVWGLAKIFPTHCDKKFHFTLLLNITYPFQSYCHRLLSNQSATLSKFPLSLGRQTRLQRISVRSSEQRGIRHNDFFHLDSSTVSESPYPVGFPFSFCKIFLLAFMFPFPHMSESVGTHSMIIFESLSCWFFLLKTHRHYHVNSCVVIM